MTKEIFARNKKIILWGMLSFLMVAMITFIVIYGLMVTSISKFTIGETGIHGHGYTSIFDYDNMMSLEKAGSALIFMILLGSITLFGFIAFGYVNSTKYNNYLLAEKGLPKKISIKKIILTILLLIIIFIAVVTLLASTLTHYIYCGDYDGPTFNDSNFGIVTEDGIFHDSSEIARFINSNNGGAFTIDGYELDEFVKNAYLNGNTQLGDYLFYKLSWNFHEKIVFLTSGILLSLSTIPIYTIANRTKIINNEYAKEKVAVTTPLSTKGKILVSSLMVTSLTSITLLIWRIFTTGEFIDFSGVIPLDKFFFNPFTTILILLIFVGGILNALFTSKTLKAGSNVKITSIVGIAYGSLIALLGLISLIFIPAIITVIFVMLIPASLSLVSSIMLFLSEEDGSEEGDSSVALVSAIITAAIISLAMKFSIVMFIITFGLGMAVIAMGSIIIFGKKEVMKIIFIISIVLGSLILVESTINAIIYHDTITSIFYIPITTTDNYTLVYLLTNIPSAAVLIWCGVKGLRQTPQEI